MSVVLNDLFDYDLKIYQDQDTFKFSLDSLLLAEYVDIKKSDGKLLDLCSGNAPIPLILASRHDISITAIELQPDIYDLGVKSIAYNNLQNKIKMLNINAKDTNNYFPGNNFDIITCNPPFFKKISTSLINEDIKKAIARHELTITLADIINISSKLLKDNGKLYLVHRPDRLEEILTLANSKNLHVKNIEFIYNGKSEYAIMVIFKFVKNSRQSVKVGSLTVNRNTKTYQNIFKRG